jgi:hypothetical protein
MTTIPSVNPGFAAKHIAGLLDADPVMARLVKEHLSPERLREVLELPVQHFESLEEAFPEADGEEMDELIRQYNKDRR